MKKEEIKEVKIEIYVPVEFVIPLRDALHEIGAGVVGKYDHCVSVTQVSGFWRPLTGAVPYCGEVGTISEGQECKMEIRCRAEKIQEALQVIRKLHPYEEPVINLIPLVNLLFDER